MAPNFSKNAILTGSVDSFCLVCETHLKSYEDTLVHVTKPVHTKALAASAFVEQYKSDKIRKVKIGYYCEVCSILLNTLTKVKLHISESDHIKSKNKVVFQREGSFVICGDIAINEEAWNGLRDDTCAVCNSEFEDVNIHKSQTSHVLNLVQARVLFHSGNLYRKFDDTSFHCITCNIIFASALLNEHFNDIEHKNLYLACHYTKNNISIEDLNAPKSDFKTEEFNQQITKEDVTEFDKEKAKKLVKSEKEYFTKIAKENNLELNKDETVAYCVKCDVSMPGLKLLKQHISDKTHKKKAAVNLCLDDIALKKIPIKEYIKSFVGVKNLFFEDIVINYKYSISYISFMLLTRLNEHLFRCHCCEITLSNTELPFHIKSGHAERLDKQYLIIEYDSEFIREVKSGLYHCGFCNMMITSWKNVKKHLTSVGHRDNKNSAKQRLEIYKETIARDEFENIIRGAFASHPLINMFK